MVRVAEAIVAYAAGESVHFTEVPVAGSLVDSLSTGSDCGVMRGSQRPIAELRGTRPAGRESQSGPRCRSGDVPQPGPAGCALPPRPRFGGRSGGFSAPTGVSLKQRLLAPEAGGKPTQES